MGVYKGMKIWREYEKIMKKPTKIIFSCNNERALEAASNYTWWNVKMAQCYLRSKLNMFWAIQM